MTKIKKNTCVIIRLMLAYVELSAKCYIKMTTSPRFEIRENFKEIRLRV